MYSQEARPLIFEIYLKFSNDEAKISLITLYYFHEVLISIPRFRYLYQ